MWWRLREWNPSNNSLKGGTLVHRKISQLHSRWNLPLKRTCLVGEPRKVEEEEKKNKKTIFLVPSREDFIKKTKKKQMLILVFLLFPYNVHSTFYVLLWKFLSLLIFPTFRSGPTGMWTKRKLGTTPNQTKPDVNWSFYFFPLRPTFPLFVLRLFSLSGNYHESCFTTGNYSAKFPNELFHLIRVNANLVRPAGSWCHRIKNKKS